MNKILQIHNKKIKPHKYALLEEFLELELLNKDVFLAGGSIRSFLMKNTETKINDYDIFFLNLSLVNSVREKLVVAGAKLIFQCPEGKLFTYKFPDEGYVDIDDYRAGMKIQLICERAYIDPVQCIMSFDMGACMGAFDDEYLYIASQMVKDVVSKNLTLNILTYPIATLKRIIKYNRKGYKTSDISKKFVEEIIDQTIHGQTWDVENLRVYID